MDKARELLQVQVNFGGGDNRNAAKPILIEVQKDHGQAVVDGLNREFGMSELFGL
jgi:hypothetical protein